MVGYVTVSQMAGSHDLIKTYLATNSVNKHYFMRVIASLYSLDFFHSLYA